MQAMVPDSPVAVHGRTDRFPSRDLRLGALQEEFEALPDDRADPLLVRLASSSMSKSENRPSMTC
jgi:hypothetical protein